MEKRNEESHHLRVALILGIGNSFFLPVCVFYFYMPNLAVLHGLVNFSFAYCLFSFLPTAIVTIPGLISLIFKRPGRQDIIGHSLNSIYLGACVAFSIHMWDAWASI